MRQIITTCLPGWIFQILRPVYQLYRNSLLGRWRYAQKIRRDLKVLSRYDDDRFHKYAMMTKYDRTRSSMEVLLTVSSHCIEKGLSYPSPRLKFGAEKVKMISELLVEYIPRYGYDHCVQMGIEALTEYCEYHRKNNIQMEALETVLQKLQSERDVEEGLCDAGTSASISLRRDEIHDAGKIDIERFLKSRHSIRHFDDQSIEKELIERAVSLAILTPSACNRQMWRVRVFQDPECKEAILGLQSGNRGFGEKIDTLLIVTCDLQGFYAPVERNEAWVNGGMFTMTLLLTLHSLGLGACCLNWSASKEKDLKLRQVVELPEEEVVVAIVAAGHIPKRLAVAASMRKPLKDILFME